MLLYVNYYKMLTIILLLLYHSCFPGSLELWQRGRQKEEERQKEGKREGGGGRKGGMEELKGSREKRQSRTRKSGWERRADGQSLRVEAGGVKAKERRKLTLICYYELST